MPSRRLHRKHRGRRVGTAAVQVHSQRRSPFDLSKRYNCKSVIRIKSLRIKSHRSLGNSESKEINLGPPPARQGSAFATHGSKIAIGSFSGDVIVLDLDLELTESSIAWPPNLEHGRVVSPSDVFAFDGASEDDDESSDIEDPEMEDSENGGTRSTRIRRWGMSTRTRMEVMMIEIEIEIEIELDPTAMTANWVTVYP